MTIEDLKNVKLSPMTAGYLAIYIKLSDLCGEAAEVTEMDYGGSAVNEVNSEFDSALGKAQDEVMKLAGKHGKIDPVGTDEIDPVKTA